MSDYVVKVSKEGHNALTAEPKDLVFDSTKNQLKVAKVIEGFVISTGSNIVRSIPHGLDYIPGFLAFTKIGNNWYGNIGEDPTYGFQWQYSADANYVYFDLSDPGVAGQTIKYKMYILVDSASPDVQDSTTEVGLGMKVSKPNTTDATTAPDKDLSISTGFIEALQIRDLYKINSTGAQTTNPHGLDYAPAWIAVAIDNDGNLFATNTAFLMPYLLVGNLEFIIWTDNQNLYTTVETIFSVDVTFYIAILTNKLDS